LVLLRDFQKSLNINLDFIQPARIEQLMQEAMAADASDMKAMNATKRYALAVILIHMKTAIALDDITLTLIIWLRGLHNKGKENLDNYRKAHTSKTDALISVLYNMLNAYKNHDTADKKIEALQGCLPEEKIEDTLIQCSEHLSYADDNYFAFMLKSYRNKRSILFQLLGHLSIKSASSDRFIETALAFIKYHQKSHMEWISQPAEKSQAPAFPDLKLLSDKWFKIITGHMKEIAVTKIHRHYFELAVFTLLANELDCGDSYVEHAYTYDDPNKEYISPEAFEENVDEFCALVGLPRDPDKLMVHLQDNLHQTAMKVDENYPHNTYLTIENGMLIVKKSPQKKIPAEFEQIKQKIMDKMPLTTIVDVIMDVEK